METIQFGENFHPLQYYENLFWHENETRMVEFFPGSYFEVTLLSTNDPNLSNYLKKIDVTVPISIDLEWEDELCLFQFCYSTTVIVLRHPKGPGNSTLFDFLKSHKFIGKGTHNDHKKLFEKFNFHFENIEDIAETRLLPYNHSVNFIKMTFQFVGRPTADFKDVRITKSNWELPELTMRQVLYAAFDAVVLFVAYPNFPPPKKLEKQKKQKKITERARKRIENFDQMSNRIQKFKTPKIKYETSERILTHNRIVLKQSEAKNVFCYLFKNYEGPSTCVDLDHSFLPFPKEHIDHIGCPIIGDRKYLIVTLNVDHPEIFEIIQSKYHNKLKNLEQNQNEENQNELICNKIKCCDPDECTDNDVLFIQYFPKELQNNEEAITLFLYSFGLDIRFTNENLYFRIQPHRAQQSLIMKTFIPQIENIKLFTFPYFLPIVRATFPYYISLNEIKSIFSRCGKIENITLMRQKSEIHDQNALITFSSVEEAEKSISEINYTKYNHNSHANSDSNTIYVQRYTDENHIRFLRFFEITVHDSINEIETRKKFEKYGKIFQCKFDKNFNVCRIQFIDKLVAEEAASKEKNVSLAPLGTMAFVRNLPFTITDQEVMDLITPYGNVLNFIYRDLDEFMRTQIVEVTYEKPEEATAIKKALHQKTLFGEELEINAVNTTETEAPIWKMQQRKLCVNLHSLSKQEENKEEQENKIFYEIGNEKMDIHQIFEYLSTFGHVIKIYGDYVMFSSFAEATNANSKLEGSSMVTVNEFVNDIFPDQFIILNVEYVKKPYQNSKPMTVVIDPLPDGLTEEIIRSMLEGADGYHLIIEADKKRALVYAKSKRAMNILHGKLHNQSFNGELLHLSKYTWHQVPKRPKNYIPFADINPPKKQPIIVDPLPKGTKALDVRNTCEGSGKFDVKVEGSAIQIGACRAVVQPRNAKAKVNCFEKLKAKYGEAKRYPKDELPSILDENLEEESDFE
ncbi:hypothetical protein TRFO_31633 [Tritrichomonas foetus]|uniref:RRM domain-containing protein n=1 Tax=Tritrichomonas foetus TaxID=1144522 RepID=A0A1J4JVI0_9EUKA|nr:hypothetical protein TRFO_31633 [Tritrichomonas foetus]|eukprot:OHT01532.1 hypothetical protein TRFO_31633 [Tritrichomonas foetus]